MVHLAPGRETWGVDEKRIKTCACGVSYTRTQWEGLGQLPDWHVEGGRTRELRNCRRCGSTLSLKRPESSTSTENPILGGTKRRVTPRGTP